MSETFYVKNSKGNFVPISFEKIVTKDWEDSLIVLRIGSDEFPGSQEDIEKASEAIGESSALDSFETISFLVTLHSLNFEVLGSINDIKDKYVAIRVVGGDDLSKLGKLQSEARKQLRGRTKKVVILPAPLTVDEYKEVMEIKRRCDTRKIRRGS